MKRLYRSESDRMLFGVCGGLGEYFGIDPTLVRFVFAGALLLGMGSPAILYLLLLLIVPRESQLDETTQARLESNVNELGEQARKAVQRVQAKLDPDKAQPDAEDTGGQQSAVDKETMSEEK